LLAGSGVSAIGLPLSGYCLIKLTGLMEALRAPSVPHRHKNSLHAKVQIVKS